MKKEEILSRSRNEKNDEYESKTFKDAQVFGIVVIVAICFLFLIMNAVVSDMKGLESGIVSFDYPAILFAYLSAVSFKIFKETKKKWSIISGIIFSLAFVCMVILYFINL
jgi:predicted membrane channel-forming protein YqfA (hemolysin III family)